MLLKEIDDKTPDLDRLQELLDRANLSSRQRTDITQQMDNIRTGFRGEKDVAYFLNDTFGNTENSIIIHDLRLEHQGRVAQIDHLIINRFCRAYVLETKSFNANLTCNEAGGWTAWYGSGKRGFPKPMASPIEQAKRHASVLSDWFKANGLTMMQRIDPVVVVSPTTFVKVKKTGVDQVPVIRADLFKEWWETRRNSGGETFLGTIWTLASKFSRSDLMTIGDLLVAAHQPIQIDWEARFGVRPGGPAAPSPALVSEFPDAPSPAEQAHVEVGTLDEVAVLSGSQPAADEQLQSTSEASTPAIVDEAGPPLPETADVAASMMFNSGNEAPEPELVVPAKVETPFGTVAVKMVTVGQYALRHATDERLSEHVRSVAQGRGRWQPRYRNWLVSGDHIATVAVELLASKVP